MTVWDYGWMMIAHKSGTPTNTFPIYKTKRRRSPVKNHNQTILSLQLLVNWLKSYNYSNRNVMPKKKNETKQNTKRQVTVMGRVQVYNWHSKRKSWNKTKMRSQNHVKSRFWGGTQILLLLQSATFTKCVCVCVFVCRSLIDFDYFYNIWYKNYFIASNLLAAPLCLHRDSTDRIVSFWFFTIFFSSLSLSHHLHLFVSNINDYFSCAFKACALCLHP